MFDFEVFSNIPPIGHLYFFYGLAFILLGIFIVFKEIKTSELKLAEYLYLLALFGFTHGAHEWLELYLLLRIRYVPAQEIFWIKLATVIIVLLSFSFLLLFGIALVASVRDNWKKRLKIIPAILFLVWGIFLWKWGAGAATQIFEKAEVLTRKIFGLPGGLLTAYGLILYSRKLKNLSLPVSRRLYYAGLTFLLYSIFAGLFPSRLSLPYLQIPVEGLRGIAAVLITYFIIKALNIFDMETKRKLQQQVKQLERYEKLAPLGKLAAGVAHEINNPLTNIALNTQMLRDELKSASSSEIMRRVDSIDKNVDKVSAITRELLQLYGKIESEMKPVDINSIIEDVLSSLQHRLKGVNVHKTLPETPDVMGDAGKLKQVFINILSNSVQAMPGGGDISIESSHAEGWVKIRIADTGVGISRENISKVFDPYFSTKEIGTGRGLGLSLCYGIINQHKGEMDIESTEDTGTTVTIKLPVANGKDTDELKT